MKKQVKQVDLIEVEKHRVSQLPPCSIDTLFNESFGKQYDKYCFSAGEKLKLLRLRFRRLSYDRDLALTALRKEHKEKEELMQMKLF